MNAMGKRVDMGSAEERAAPNVVHTSSSPEVSTSVYDVNPSSVAVLPRAASHQVLGSILVLHVSEVYNMIFVNNKMGNGRF